MPTTFLVKFASFLLTCHGEVEILVLHLPYVCVCVFPRLITQLATNPSVFTGSVSDSRLAKVRWGRSCSFWLLMLIQVKTQILSRLVDMNLSKLFHSHQCITPGLVQLASGASGTRYVNDNRFIGVFCIFCWVRLKSTYCTLFSYWAPRRN